jgi:hypothetical protein
MALQGNVFTSATIVLSTPTMVKKLTYFPSVSSSIVLAFSRTGMATTTTSVSLTNFDSPCSPITLMENTVATYFEIVAMVGGTFQIEIL